MKLFKASDHITCYRQDNSDFYINYGLELKFNHGHLTYKNYELSKYGIPFSLNGKIYQKKVGTQGVVTFININDCLLDLPDFFLEKLEDNEGHTYGDFFTAYVRNYPKRRCHSLILFDCVNKTFIHKEIRAVIHRFLEADIYGQDFDTKEIFKLDKNLDSLWKFNPEFPSLSTQIIGKYLNTVIVFIGPENEERNLVDGHAKYTCSGGQLFGLDDADGSVAWQIDMPHSMDGYELVGDTLYAVSLNEIFLINPETGEIKRTLDTETSTPFNRDLKPTITVDDKFIYYTHYDDAVILVYDVNTLDQVRRIDMPEGYYPKEHNFHDENTGKQYFTIHNKTQYVAQWPVLEIDPNDIDSTVEFEQEPEMSIELIPAEGNDQEKEVVIKLRTASLDDALRFGEIYTRDEAQRYSHNFMNMTFMGRPFAPEKSINGIVRFIYSGSKEDEAKVNEHLRIMEKRFEKWIEKEGFFACTDTSQPTRLIAEYIES